MKADTHDLQTRLDAIRQRLRLSREAVAAGDNVNLDALGGEVQNVSETLHTAPLQIDRKALVRDLEAIITDLDSLQQELSAHHGIIGGETIPNDGADD